MSIKNAGVEKVSKKQVVSKKSQIKAPIVEAQDSEIALIDQESAQAVQARLESRAKVLNKRPDDEEQLQESLENAEAAVLQEPIDFADGRILLAQAETGTRTDAGAGALGKEVVAGIPAGAIALGAIAVAAAAAGGGGGSAAAPPVVQPPQPEDPANFFTLVEGTGFTSGIWFLEGNGDILVEIDGLEYVFTLLDANGDPVLDDNDDPVQERVLIADLDGLNATDFAGNLDVDVSGSIDLKSVVTGDGDDRVAIDIGYFNATNLNDELEIDLGGGTNTLEIRNGDGLTVSDINGLDFDIDGQTLANIQVLAFADGFGFFNDFDFETATLSLAGLSDLHTIRFEGYLDLAIDQSDKLIFSGYTNEHEVQNIAGEDVTGVALRADFAGGAGWGDMAFENVEYLFVTGGGFDGIDTVIAGDSLVEVSVNSSVHAGIVMNDVTGSDYQDLTSISVVANDWVARLSLVGKDPGSGFESLSLVVVDANEGDADLDLIDVYGNGVDPIAVNVSATGAGGDAFIIIGDTGELLIDITGVEGVTTFEFVGADIANITITGFTSGDGGDILDLSSFGIDFADLSGAGLDIDYSGADAVITSDAFTGSITLLAIADDSLTDQNFFA